MIHSFKYTFVLYCLYFTGYLTAQDTYSIAINIPQSAEAITAMEAIEDEFIVMVNTVCLPDLEECLVLSKLGMDGELKWYKKYRGVLKSLRPLTGTGNQGFHIHNDSTYYLSAFMFTADADHDGVIIKTNEEGDSLWMKRYGTLHFDALNNILPYRDSTLLVLGSYGTGNQLVDLKTWLYIADLDGNILDEHFYGEQFGTSIAQDLIWAHDSTLLLSYTACETPNCNVAESNNLHIARLNNDLEVLWDNPVWEVYVSSVNHAVLELDDGNIAVSTHRHNDQGGALTPPVLLWLDENGNLTDQYEFPVNRLSEIHDLFQTNNGLIIGAGNADIFEEGIRESAGWIFAFSPEGEMLWNRYIKDGRTPFTSSQFFTGLELEDGSLVFGGEITDTISGTSDLWLVKLDADGCLEPGCSELQVVTPTREIALLQEQFEVFPNPVEQGKALFIQNENSVSSNYLYTLIDVQRRYRQEGQCPVSDILKIKTEGLESGIYFLQIINEDGKLVQVEKIVIH